MKKARFNFAYMDLMVLSAWEIFRPGPHFILL